MIESRVAAVRAAEPAPRLCPNSWQLEVIVGPDVVEAGRLLGQSHERHEPNLR
jgi:hypothetical protein